MREDSGIKAFLNPPLELVRDIPGKPLAEQFYQIGDKTVFVTKDYKTVELPPIVNLEITAPPLTGHWHHGNGVLVSGGTRIAKEDFDCQPFNPNIRDEIFDWICKTLNKEIDLYYANRGDRDADS